MVSYPPSYKKTPPPVPPRTTTTKPLISVTAQSSTESTQDAYQESRHPRGGLWTTDSLGRPIYSSMDSLDSTKAVTMAMESAASKRHASLGSHTSVQTCDKAVLVSKAEEYLKTPRSSVGIQVISSNFFCQRREYIFCRMLSLWMSSIVLDIIKQRRAIFCITNQMICEGVEFCPCTSVCLYMSALCCLCLQVETVTDSETESKGLPQFHSIGIQVEDHKRYVVQMTHTALILVSSL